MPPLWLTIDLSSFNEIMNHSFDVEVAKQYGVPQAIIIANFQHWISYNAANGTNYHEGRYWTYNSHKALAEIFPYFSESQCKRIIQSLVDAGVLLRKCFNQRSFDKTNWYTFIDIKKFIPFTEGKKPKPNRRNKLSESSDEIKYSLDEIGYSLGEIVTPIPVNTTDNKPTDSKTKNSKKGCSEKNAASASYSEFAFSEGSGSSGAQQKKPPVAQAPQEAKLKTLYNQMMYVYFDWHNQQVGVDPIIDGGQGKAMKEMVNYFECQAKKKLDQSGSEYSQSDIEQNAVLAFQTLLFKLGDGVSIEPFYSSQVKLTQIYSNLQNIINQLKNGNPKQQQQRATGKPSGETIEDIKSRLNAKYGAGQ
jgi:hypothetical protein